MIFELGIRAVESGHMPDWLVRLGIRYNCSLRLRELTKLGHEAAFHDVERFITELRNSPVAIETGAANEQHYEVPAAFFDLVLGKHKKYSSALWRSGVTSLDEAETAMLEQTVANAELEDGMRILELGCGWGSLTLFMAERFPNAEIVAVSNSHSQREYILAQAAARGIDTVTVVTADVNSFSPEGTFDRVVSVEMFEHMRNYDELLGRIATWLQPGGKLFVHIFCHRDFAYPYETDGADNWMGKYFFTGGIMPSRDLLTRFPARMQIQSQHMYSGMHYAKTANAWVANMDTQRSAILPILAETYGTEVAEVWFQRWRIFFLACAELFGYARGEEWMVTHLLFTNGWEQ
jgi:cyclopropane-fatty-acyl-phospholipid synthase